MPLAETHVLLFPEDLEHGPSVSSAVYGTVLTTRGGVATVGLLSPPHIHVQVRHALVRARRIDSTEFSRGAVGEWMRKAVMGIHNDQYVYGQVVAYDGDTVTIRTAEDDVVTTSDDLHEVAPVLCFLLVHSNKTVTDTPPQEVARQHVMILDRLLGSGEQQRTRGRSRSPTSSSGPTRSIPRLLAGILPPRLHPRSDSTRSWINESTGVERTVSCRHAIDFAYYIDGGVRVPAAMQDLLGRSFDDDPSQLGGSPNRAQVASTSPLLTQANPTTGPTPMARSSVPNPMSPNNVPDTAMADPSAEIEALLQAVASSSTPSQAQAPPPMNGSAADNHAKILAAIADNPVLVRFYLSSCQPAGTKRLMAHDDARPTQRRRLDSPSDLIYDEDTSNRRPKHAFAPTRVQQGIYDLIASEDYSGKDPTTLADTMISSRATKFKPHPAIIARIYAFEFGARGLSIMHFARFDFAARRAWYAAASVNLNNFGPSVALPKALRPVSLDDLAGALTVLHVFTEEFMDPHTCRLISSAREFVEELRSFCRWSPQDVETLAFWFDTLFESYRVAAEHDSRHGSSTRTSVRNKLSLQDPDLQSVLYVIQSERLANLSRPPPASNAGEPGFRSDQYRYPDQYRQNDQHRSNRPRPPPRTPREVIEALPRQGRLTVCMKYLSARGCASKSDDRCAFPNHAHFIPDDLPPIVRQHIAQNMGGLRQELRQ